MNILSSFFKKIHTHHVTVFIFQCSPDQQSKRRKVERSNRKRVICVHCDKVLNADNTKYHHESKHRGQKEAFRTIPEKKQQILNFGVAVQNEVRIIGY